MSKPDLSCPKCGCAMEQGGLGLRNLPVVTPGLLVGGVQIVFETGEKTSLNPLKAFTQGLHDDPGDRVHNLSQMTGFRCDTCDWIIFQPTS